MSKPKFWFVPIKHIAFPEQQSAIAAMDEVHASDLPASYSVPSKLYQEGIRPGHLLALVDSNTECVTALARVLELDRSGTLHWLRLPLLKPPTFSAEPELRLVTAQEADRFRIGIDALLRDARTVGIGPEELVAIPTPALGTAKNIILYGPPGTGKTYHARRRALALLGHCDASTAPDHQVTARWNRSREAGQVAFCTFHQAFAYEDFMEGLRATTEDGNVKYELKDGIFKTIAHAAARQPEKAFVLVIDEINRANIAKVFGDIITLLEPDKRLGQPREIRAQLPGSKESFGVPANLHVLSTMNTADRSIALMDVALRRRFSFEEMMPCSKALGQHLEERTEDENLRQLVLAVFEKLNERLRFLLDRDHQIGHAYFFDIQSLDDLRDRFAHRIIPLLQEYFYGRWDKIALVLGHPRAGNGWDMSCEHAVMTVCQLREMQILGFEHDDYEDQLRWDVREEFLPRSERVADADAGAEWLRRVFEQVAKGSAGT